MGALTLKSFPFILRSWNVKSYDSINPTDSFGQNTKVYINRNKIIKIEPQFSNNTTQPWLTDKGRQFFDSMFRKFSKNVIQSKDVSTQSTKQWQIFFDNINKMFYIFDICNFKNASRFFFVIIFENVSLETLNFLSLISQTHSFIKIRRVESSAINVNLETSFQINSATSISKLSTTSLCILIGTNSRYEGSYLNLKLRQRYYKGNFTVFSIGPFLDLTFPVSFLGSNIAILKSISEGNHVICKDIINAENPLIITNTEFFKHVGSKELLNTFKICSQINVLNKIWIGHNVLNSSLSETGIYNLKNFSSVNFKDFEFLSSVYMINVNLNNSASLKKLSESRLLEYKTSSLLLNEKLLLHQNFYNSFNSFSSFKKYLYLPNNIFFETQDTFVNTEGYLKKTVKLISRKNVKNDWQLLRKLHKKCISNLAFNNFRKNKILFYQSKSLFDFKNFIYFQFQATQNLTNLNFYLSSINQKFIFCNKFNKFKLPSVKLFNTKIKYWLDDFYLSGKDIFCQNSVTLVRCSNNYRQQVSTFF